MVCLVRSCVLETRSTSAGAAGLPLPGEACLTSADLHSLLPGRASVTHQQLRLRVSTVTSRLNINCRVADRPPSDRDGSRFTTIRPPMPRRT